MSVTPETARLKLADVNNRYIVLRTDIEAQTQKVSPAFLDEWRRLFATWVSFNTAAHAQNLFDKNPDGLFESTSKFEQERQGREAIFRAAGGVTPGIPLPPFEVPGQVSVTGAKGPLLAVAVVAAAVVFALMKGGGRG